MISGSTTLVAHLGFPTDTFTSPLICNPWFEHHDIDAAVVPMGVRREHFPEFFRSLCAVTNLRGALITMPHKVTALDLVDELSPDAAVARATNAVLLRPDGTLLAEQFDGAGFVRGAMRKGFDPAGRRALVVGTGGVGSAIAAALAGSGLSGLGLYDSDLAVAEQLAGRVVEHHRAVEVTVGSNDPAGYDMVVNATPSGMSPDDPPPVDVERVEPGTFVGDVVLTREKTPFLRDLESRGCTVQVGSDMLFEMIPAYLDFFGFPGATPDALRATARL